MALNAHRVTLVKQMDLVSVLPYLRQDSIITECMEEEVCSANTKMGKVSKLLDLLTRRGPRAIPSLVNALVATDQHDLAHLLDSSVTLPRKVVCVLPNVQFTSTGSSMPMASSRLDALKRALDNANPIEKSSERYGNRYLTSVNIFSDRVECSMLGAREIAFLFAVQSGLYTEESVLGWKEAPSKLAFEQSLKRYRIEIKEVEDLLASIDNAGIDMIIRVADERLVKLIAKQTRQGLYTVGNTVRLTIPVLHRNHMTPLDLALFTCTIHLVNNESSFVIRKTSPPKPNSYLIYSAGLLIDSSVIMERDRRWVRDALNQDESVKVLPPDTECPW